MNRSKTNLAHPCTYNYRPPSISTSTTALLSVVVIGLACLFSPSSAFLINSSTTSTRNTHSFGLPTPTKHQPKTQIFTSTNDEEELYRTLSSSTTPSSKKTLRPKNEFSRCYNLDRILGSSTNTQRTYTTSIQATQEELQRLAERFRLEGIEKLEAEVVLRNENYGRRKRDKAGPCIHANVQLSAIVTQTCVRTNEPFPQEMNHDDIFAAVRPVSSTASDSQSQSQNQNQNQNPPKESESLQGTSNNNNNKKQKSSRKQKHKPSHTTGTSHTNDLNLQQLQQLLSEEFDVEEEALIEDEAIWSTSGRNELDVGELVAQLFCVRLDPYPKKPGSKPVRFTFTG